jgi:hypothetical protein
MPETRIQRTVRQAKIADLLEKKRTELSGAAKDNNFMIDHAINLLRSPNATDEAQIRMLDKASNFLKLHAREEHAIINKPTRSELYHKAENQRLNDGVDSAIKTGKSALGFAGDLLKGGTALVSHTLGFAGTGLSLTGKGIVRLGAMAYHGYNTLGAFSGLGRIGRATLAGGIVAGAVGYLAIPINANEQASLLGHTIAQAQLHQACLNPLVLKADTVSAAFSVAHGNHNAGIDMIRRASEKALLHGVAPEAPFYIAAYETNGFRDLVANNSSATNPWQMVDSTKFAYIKHYGQQTFKYKEAVERLDNGTSLDRDSDLMIRDSINAVVDASQTQINDAIKQSKFPPLLFAAKNLANDIFFSAELVSLDIYKNAPELRLENLDDVSAEERLQLTAGYYAPEHLLGATNTRYVQKLVEANPNIRVSNVDATDDVIGAEKAKTLKQVVNNNKGAIPQDVTAGQMIPSIMASFAKKIDDISEPVIRTAHSASSAFELCVTNRDEIGREVGPIMATRAEIYYAVAASYLPTDTINGIFNTVQGGVSAVTDVFKTAETAAPALDNAKVEALILGIN